MSDNIFDLDRIKDPTLILAKRNCSKLGVISTASNIVIKRNMSEADELSFTVSKQDWFTLWDDIKSFRLVWIQELDEWFEMSVQTTSGDAVTKEVTCTSLCEAELSQINLYNIEINTEEDIARDDYVATVLYNSENPGASLLDRILEKAPHYSIGHVDSTISNIQRSFSFDSKSIIDALNEIAEEISCLFVFSNDSSSGKAKRTINVYDLMTACTSTACSYYKNHGNNFYRDSLFTECPHCGATGNYIHKRYGVDTGVFVSGDNIASEITKEPDGDSVKNCFRLESGDELMDRTIMNCNPNGTQYLWHFSDSQRNDMSAELKSKLTAYDSAYNTAYKSKQINLNSTSVNNYNTLVNKYNAGISDESKKYSTIITPVSGYSNLMLSYYGTIDFKLYLQTSLMPEVTINRASTAAEEAQKFKTELRTTYNNTISLSSLIASTSAETVEASFRMLARTIIDSSLFTFEINRTSWSVSKSGSTYSGTWKGSVTITAIAEDADEQHDTATASAITLSVNGLYDNYLQQLVTRTLKDSDTDDLSVSGLFAIETDTEFKAALKNYSADSLENLYNCCTGALSVLQEKGSANSDSDTYSIYSKYYKRQKYITTERELRIKEVAKIENMQTKIVAQQDKIKSDLDIKTYLGEDLWEELSMFRREDSYKNDNYVSDGLDNAELFANALEFIEVAKKDLNIASTLQHTITADVSNLFTMSEFESLWDNFAIGNWIRVQIDNEIYKLRLISYEIQFDNIEEMSVEFSDVELYSGGGGSDIKSLMSSLSSMSSSYDSVKHQSTVNSKATRYVNNWVDSGFDITNSQIVSANDDQVQTWDEHGMLLRKIDPVTNSYDDSQMKLVNRGLYITDDNWEHCKAAIGNFVYQEADGSYNNCYGVLADTIVGKMILGQYLEIRNSSGSMVFDSNGFTVSGAGQSLSFNESTSETITISDSSTPQSVSTSGTHIVINNAINHSLVSIENEDGSTEENSITVTMNGETTTKTSPCEFELTSSSVIIDSVDLSNGIIVNYSTPKDYSLSEYVKTGAIVATSVDMVYARSDEKENAPEYDISKWETDINEIPSMVNIIPAKYETQTSEGLTWTVKSDGSISVSGTLSSGYTSVFNLLPSETYIDVISDDMCTISGLSGNDNYIEMTITTNTGEEITYSGTEESLTFEASSFTEIESIDISISASGSDIVLSNYIIYPMLEFGDSHIAYRSPGLSESPKYIWQRTYTKYSDGSSSASTPNCVNSITDITVGDASVQSMVEQYCVKDIGQTPEDSDDGWSNQQPDVLTIASDQTVWTRTVIIYNNGVYYSTSPMESKVIKAEAESKTTITTIQEKQTELSNSVAEIEKVTNTMSFDDGTGLTIFIKNTDSEHNIKDLFVNISGEQISLGCGNHSSSEEIEQSTQAYITQEKMHIKSADIGDTIVIGAFAFTPDSEHLVFGLANGDE